MMFLSPFLWIVIIIVLYFVAKRILVLKNVHKLPGPPCTNLLIGNIGGLLDTQENVFKRTRAWALQYYPIYKLWCLHVATVNIYNPYDCEAIFCNMKHIAKSDVYSVTHNWLGTGLLTSEGSKWQHRRKLLTPSFHFNILQEFIQIFKEETKKLVEVLKIESEKPFTEITGYISDFTLHTIAETSMGISLDQKSSKSLKYVEAVHGIGKIITYRACHPWLWNKFLYFLDLNYYKEMKLVKILHRFTEAVIFKRERTFEPVSSQDQQHNYSKRKRLAMLDLLLTAKKTDSSIDDEGIREEVDTFMFEGHDTTSSAISTLLMLLACHPKIQDRIVDEIREVLGSSSKLDYKTLQDLKYMEMCIKEALRMYPSVPFIGRVLGEDMVTYSGHYLKAGSIVHIHIYDLHHNPTTFPDPEKFDPDRFLPENCQNRHTFAYVPFSAGPRNCIGQKFAMLELKTVLCGILSEFVLEPVDTPNTIILKIDIILRTKNGIRIKFVNRTDKIFTSI